MRSKIILGAVALGAVSTLVVAAPASAAVVTTVEVTDVDVVHTTGANFSHGVYVPWSPEGAATFPSTVDTGVGLDNYTLQGFQPDLSTLGQGCTAEIVSFSVDLESLQPINLGTQASFYVGVPAAPVVGTTAVFDGIGTLAPESDWFRMNAANGAVDGVLTVTLPEAIGDDVVPLAWVGLFTDGPAAGALWQVNSVSFLVTQTCPDPAPAAALVATGEEMPTVAALAGLALVAVGGALALGRARRARA